MDVSDQEKIIQRLVGSKIRELRRAAGIRSMELAELSGLSQGQVSKIENGKATISINALSRLCQVLDRPLSYLFQSREEIPRVMGTLNTVGGPERRGMIRFAEEVFKRSNGSMSLIPLKASQLYPAGDQVEQLRQGVIDIFIDNLKYFSTPAPGVETLCLPYCFDSREHALAFMDGDFFENQVRRNLINSGIRLLNHRWNWWRGLEWVMVSNRPIVSPDQIKGVRVRVEDIPVSADFWAAMGAKPVTIPWAEVKMALRLGHIDVLPTQKTHLYPMGFCNYARYVTRLGDVAPLLSVAVNDTKYQALPPSTQKIMVEACDWAGEMFSELIREAEEENEAKNLEEYRAAYLQVDQAPWRKAVSGAMNQLLKEGKINRVFWEAIDKARSDLARTAGEK